MLEGLLRQADVTEVVVVGLAGDYCVGETALDAALRGFEVLVPLALARFVNPHVGDDTRMIARLCAAGVEVAR